MQSTALNSMQDRRHHPGFFRALHALILDVSWDTTEKILITLSAALALVFFMVSEPLTLLQFKIVSREFILFPAWLWGTFFVAGTIVQVWGRRIKSDLSRHWGARINMSICFGMALPMAVQASSTSPFVAILVVIGMWELVLSTLMLRQHRRNSLLLSGK